ncbi:long-chain fatty acid--CoA ligase [Haloterrigena sp. H1]|uniref:class I adenylate-forming enzyme family protein n=1 Tax=Haloterrigena sp. H1 TaxID=2552943 RepID=UPI00110E321E|nr:class I adenylate-forming enzyme family protein [Haloterrigena sp. H1]TMT85132.1 long-chain fatty acid--CoA ligase [Haloterrigena sp. H1]
MGATTVTLSLARRADHFPDRTAVVDISERRLHAPTETIHEDRVSYEELSTIAERTAERLAAREVEAGDTVCLVTRNRVPALALCFACRRLGATFAPISHLLTPATVERPFDVIEPELVVAEAAQRDLVRSIPFDRVVTLEELAETEGEPVDRGERPTDATPALVLHGETGRPVAGYSITAIEQNCITGVVAWGLAANDVVPLTTPLSTADGLVRVALSVLYVGGTLLLDRAFDPGDATTAMAAADATLLCGRERAIRDIAAESGFDDAVDSLKRVVCEGPIDDEAVAAYRDRDVPVAPVYGRLECPTAMSGGFDTDPSGFDADSAPVGRPVPSCRARLVDEAGTVLEGAADGQLQLSGPMLADGYMDSAETDAAADHGRFVDGWFHTGDRFHRDGDGSYQLR